MHATRRPVQTRFRSGSGVIRLNLATYIKSPIHDAKGTESRVAHAVPQPRPSFLGRFGLFRVRSPLLAESNFLSSPRGTEMFHFPRFARARLWIQRAVRRHYPPWVSPFGHLRIKAWLAAPRSLSQLPASFFASCRLGIHRVPFP